MAPPSEVALSFGIALTIPHLLTERQANVLRLRCAGKTTVQTAAELGIKPETIGFHDFYAHPPRHPRPRRTGRARNGRHRGGTSAH